MVDVYDEHTVCLATKAGRGICDPGAGWMLMGRETLEQHRVEMAKQGRTIEEQAEFTPLNFRFGDSKTLHPVMVVHYPIGLAGKVQGYLKIHVVEGSAPLLISSGVWELLGGVLDMGRHRVRSELSASRAGL